MNPAALAFALNFIAQLPALIAAGFSIEKLVSDHQAKQAQFAAENRVPTVEEWDALNSGIDALEKKLQAE